jgi:hypothetical protein
MLAKKTWMLIAHLHTLYAQVLRANYYPDGNMLNMGPKGVHLPLGIVL